ncbi:MAG: hypothetical protein L6R45_23035 [Anaerolineae bacterium]|nr:hypothetical protein [Anaerolineae bacterium]
MTFSLENVFMLDMVSRKDDKHSKEAAPQNRVDFDIFGAKEIRDVLKSRAHCLRAGFPAYHVIIATLNEIRDHYILKVGLPTYLSQMLGEVAKTPIQYCTLYDPRDAPIQLDLPYNRNQPLQRFIAQRFQWDELPFRVEVRKDTDPNRVEVRYL